LTTDFAIPVRILSVLFSSVSVSSSTGPRLSRALPPKSTACRGALFGDAIDGFTGFAACGLADDFEHAVKALHLTPCLALVLRESGLDVRRLRRLGHLGQRLQYLVLGEINILQRLIEKFGFLANTMSFSIAQITIDCANND